ncbi:hypothetical protein [Haloarcula laminariae]|uniref:hypothetical protein n=1 Tax=Haloarcula laminariae TaxID=2961577 RepID=UPI0021C6B2D4|nr:hypothetical protein [Halomicroarcula laminariae]
MAADSSGGDVPIRVDSKRIQRIDILVKAAHSAREKGDNSAAKKNFHSALHEISECTQNISSTLNKDDLSSSDIEELEDTQKSLQELEKKIRNEVKLL